MTVICQYCQQPAEWVPNEVIYGRRYGDSYMMWLCRDCDAWVGTHLNSQTPLGTLANKELRDLRRAVHERIDPLWRSKRYRRETVYAALSFVLGRDGFHVGESDVETCKKILALKF